MTLLRNFPPPAEGVHHCEPNTTAVFHNKELGKGTLYISESVLCWLSSDGEGFSLDYLSINIHGISKDEMISPEPCLFLLVDGSITLDGGSKPAELAEAMNSMSVEEEDSDEELENTQIRFVPDNKEMLEVMFNALSDCQAMNPDPQNEDDIDDGDELFVSPSFNVQIADRPLEEYEEDDEGMNEDQFEDAEQ